MKFPPRVYCKTFLGENILGTIPFMKYGNVSMTESTAICMYLVDIFGPTTLKVLPTELDYHLYLNFLHQADATLTFPQAVVLRYTKQQVSIIQIFYYHYYLDFQKNYADNAAVDYAKWYIARLRLLDKLLEDDREFLVCNRFTIADICITYSLYLSRALDLRVDGELLEIFYKEKTLKYMERMIGRPAFQKVLEIQATSEELCTLPISS